MPPFDVAVFLCFNNAPTKYENSPENPKPCPTKMGETLGEVHFKSVTMHVFLLSNLQQSIINVCLFRKMVGICTYIETSKSYNKLETHIAKKT